MTHRPEFKVVVVGYDSRDDVLRCLDSLAAQDYDRYSVTYVDNDSADGSVAAVRDRFPDVAVVENDENLGFARACNRAIAAIDAPYVALLNPDAVAPPGWLSAYADAIAGSDDRDRVLAWSGTVRIADSDRLHYAGTKLTPMGSAVNSALLRTGATGTHDGDPAAGDGGGTAGHGDGDGTTGHGDAGGTADHPVPRWTAAPCGANAVLDVDRFREIGGFDDDFFLYFEDADLGWRAWLLGYRVAFVPSAAVDHDLGGVVGGRSPFATPGRVRHTTRNRKAMLVKNAGLRLLVPGLSLTVAYDLLSLGRAALAGRWGVLRAALAGEAAFLRDFPGILRRRREVQAARRRSDADLRDLGLFISLAESVRFYRRIRNAYH